MRLLNAFRCVATLPNATTAELHCLTTNALLIPLLSSSRYAVYELSFLNRPLVTHGRSDDLPGDDSVTATMQHLRYSTAHLETLIVY